MKMKMKRAVAAVFCAACVCAASAAEYTYQALYWQVDENATKYGAAYATLYAVVDGVEGKGGEGLEIADARAGTMSVFVGEGKSEVWTLSSAEISQASFYVELLTGGDAPVSVARSDLASYGALGAFMDRNYKGSGDPGTTASTYTFTFAIPEPTGASLVLLGLAGLALRRKRLA